MNNFGSALGKGARIGNEGCIGTCIPDPNKFDSYIKWVEAKKHFSNSLFSNSPHYQKFYALKSNREIKMAKECYSKKILKMN